MRFKLAQSEGGMRNFRLDREMAPAAGRVEMIDYGAQRENSPAFVSDIRTIWTALTARWLLVAACTIGAVFMALAYIWVVPPTYEATAEVLIDPRRRAVFDREIVQSGMGQSSLGADTFLLDSQVDVMLSQSVLRQVIARLDLANDPDLGTEAGGERPSLGIGSLVRFIVRGPRAASIPAMSSEDRLLATLRESLEVYRKGNTYVLGVTMESPNPVTSAAVANALSEVYISELGDLTRSQITDVEEQLGGRLEELRDAATESQRRVEAYRTEHGLLSAERLTIVEQQLRDLNQQLSIVATTTNAARSRWEEVSKLRGQRLDHVLASGALDSPHLDSLRQQYSSLASREASLSATLMPRHPSLQAVRDSKMAVQADISREVDRIAARYRVELDVAASNEQSIRAQITQLEAAAALTNQATVGLRELERQAASDAAIYEQFLVKSKDAREQVNLPSDVARVISQARPDYKPTWPAPILLLPAALIVGLGAGLCLALGLHLFAGAPAARARAETRRPILGAARA